MRNVLNPNKTHAERILGGSSKTIDDLLLDTPPTYWGDRRTDEVETTPERDVRPPVDDLTQRMIDAKPGEVIPCTDEEWEAHQDFQKTKREPYPDGNPKTAAGLLKTPLRLVPTIGIEAEARVFRLGAAKYGAYNWRELNVSCSVYYEAAMRHLFAWFNGEDIDPESGELHIAHVRACMGILLDAEAHGKLNDDRPPRPVKGEKA